MHDSVLLFSIRCECRIGPKTGEQHAVNAALVHMFLCFAISSNMLCLHVFAIFSHGSADTKKSSLCRVTVGFEDVAYFAISCEMPLRYLEHDLSSLAGSAGQVGREIVA
jgi:hypothetical protein